MKKIIIIIIISIFFSMTADADSVHITYISLVDPNLGFYKVTDSTAHKPAPYVGRVLTINQGDSVVWRNDADPSSPVTIVSDQDLFPDSELKLINDVFSYTFNQAGIFTFYIKEREMAKQTIIVNGIGIANTPVISPTVNAPVATPNITSTNVPNMTSPNIMSSNNGNGNVNESSNIENNIENNTENYTENYTNDSNNIKNSSNLSVISIASIMVAIISILTMFNTRKR